MSLHQHATFERVKGTLNHVFQMSVVEKRDLFVTTRLPQVNENTLFPNEGITVGEFSIGQILLSSLSKQNKKAK